jgi:hypothetical protein
VRRLFIEGVMKAALRSTAQLPTAQATMLQLRVAQATTIIPLQAARRMIERLLGARFGPGC